MTQKPLEDIVVCQCGVVSEVHIQNNTKGSADDSAIEAKFSKDLGDNTLPVSQQGNDQQHPHDHITRIYGEKLIVLHSDGSSVSEIVNPKVAVMDHNGDNGKKFQYFIFRAVVRCIFIGQYENNQADRSGNDHIKNVLCVKHTKIVYISTGIFKTSPLKLRES